MSRVIHRPVGYLFPILALLLAAAATPAHADFSAHKGTFVAGGGWNNPTGQTSDFLTSGGSLFFGGGRHLNGNTALQIEYMHHWMGIQPEVIQRASSDSVQFDNTYASMWSITLNGIYRYKPHNPFVPWVTGGGGYYKRNLLITQNSLFYVPPFFDPWWGWIGGGWVPGEAITGKRSDNGFGFNVGIGVDIQMDAGLSMFVDARYHHAYMPGVDMDIIPIMFGLRW